MKKFLCLALAILMLVSTVFVIAGCAKKEEPLKIGMGIHAAYEKVASATAEANGTGQAAATIAAVLLDAENKIVKCEIDTADNTVEFTAEGKFVTKNDFKTKYELGDDYNMVAWGGAKAEWFTQVDAFEKLTIGKTIDQVKALEADGGKGNADVIAAGCTITVSDFVKALEKAVANAKESNAVASNTLKLGVVSSMEGENATEEKPGSITVETSFVAAATDADGKVTAFISDALQVKYAFDLAGVTSTDKATALKTKRELGKDYNMVAWGGAAKEWFEQADAFDTNCIGKTSAEIAGFAKNDGKPAEALVSAGCTISVGDMVKAAAKATK